ncbi:hypothetical protein GCM10009037_20090 [Halarchaeum grantii]|uniref:Uncharacterized protein n=1 Tax=Halarchaeum grantii TaxID=1193105 RepID=A0A830FDP9_9EURY|nr:hypothetical protein [Halarchaeum grantii]GGL36534.1 hypothetical protein GCM10009037_20090 [Halarchaeum grantii]
MGTDDGAKDPRPPIEDILDDEIADRDAVERYRIIERTRHEAEVILFEEDETGAIKRALYQLDVTHALDGTDYHAHWTFIGYRSESE